MVSAFRKLEHPAQHNEKMSFACYDDGDDDDDTEKKTKHLKNKYLSSALRKKNKIKKKTEYCYVYGAKKANDRSLVYP